MLQKILTRRIGFDDADSLFAIQKEGIKTVFTVSED
jgi:hypothetical protein